MTPPSPSQSLVAPDDEHNRTLVGYAHPADWVNPTPTGRYNLVVLGAGTAGLVSAVGAASLGAKVAIVERHLTGGDCLNFGCVPSKALISAARAAAGVRSAGRFGIGAAPAPDPVDFAAVMARMRRLRAGIAKNDSVGRLASLGVDVYLGDARFIQGDAVAVGDQTLKFSRAVIATGARPTVPDVPGLAETGFYSNETIFSLTERPRHLLVIGAGPIGCELAQTFRRLGSAVTLILRGGGLLPRDDADASAIVERTLLREGVTLIRHATILRAERRAGDQPRVLVYEASGAQGEVAGDEILVAVGRSPNVEDLDLAAGGVAWHAAGVIVDDFLRTTNRRVYAAGDICSRHKFTHAADAMARIVLQNALFFGRKRASALVVPWATYTDPEVAHVGLSAGDAEQRGDAVSTLTVELSENDRAILDDDAEGFARVHVDRRTGAILGATMVAGHAGELIGEMVVAMRAGVRMGSIGLTIHPYPTQSEAWKRLGDAWNRSRLTPRLRAVLRAVLRWRR
ncbi:MAG: mercuric reductase [Acidobacteria bacterium]|nr:mercuric reductase [Acidobacteriota bacterium]